MKRILIIGGWNTTHIRRFLSVLCKNKEEDLIIDSFDPRIHNNQGNEPGVDYVFRIKANKLEQNIYKLRKLGTFLFQQKSLNVFEKILQQIHYDLVNIHQVPYNAYNYIKIAHKYGVRTMLTPLGSDILRASKWSLSLLRKAFNETDYVSLNVKTGFCQKVCEIFHLPQFKVINLGYGSETLSSLIENMGILSRKQCIDLLGLPESSFYICCGYNASRAQRHSAIIRSIAESFEALPEDYCLLIPLSYGTAKNELYEELSLLCKQHGLRTHFIVDFLSVDQVAALRMVTDLFIHVQTTDAYNASLQECLLAGSQVINGKWLDYPSLEEYGKPYHICESLETLSDIIGKVLRHDVSDIVVHPQILEVIKSGAWNHKIVAWKKFYSQL